MAKRFNNGDTDSVYRTMGLDDPVTYTEQEALDAQEAMKTQGKAGLKLQRINMAFSPSNLDYIRIMSKAKGISMTNFVNEIITQERETNGETYYQLKSLMESLK